MGLFDFIGGAIDTVGDFFGGEDLFGTLGTAVVKTAGQFIVGGPSGQQQASRQPQLQSKVAGDLAATSRVPRPSVPGPASIADYEAIHAEWLSRMRRFAGLEAVTRTGSPRTLGTQARRS